MIIRFQFRLALSCLVLEAVTALWLASPGGRPVRLLSYQRRSERSIISALSYSENEDNQESQDDWRDVRAKLIRQYKVDKKQLLSQLTSIGADNTDAENSGGTTSATSASNATSASTTAVLAINGTASSTSTRWAYDSGDAIEKGSLIISHPVQDFACGGLKQQYFHKCVVLVVHHDAYFTKGIILNRSTGKRGKVRDKHGMEWSVWFGGDVLGLYSPQPDYICLHRLKSSKALEISLPVVKDIQHTTWELAQLLVQQGGAQPDDFWLGCGYAGWGPNQLQRELERGNWFMAATDSESISKVLHSRISSGENDDDDNDDDTTPTGMRMWNDFMSRIEKESIMEQYCNNQEFEDTMLREWVQHRLIEPPPSPLSRGNKKGKRLVIEASNTESSSSSSSNSSNNEEDQILQEGMILRPTRPAFLEEQVFHESLVLILNTDRRGTMGVILNRPSSTSVELKGKNLPLRYGGRYGLEDQGKPETWLHCGNDALRDAKVGVPILPDDSSLVWQCTREDAETAVELGLADPEDFMVILGLTLWEKNPPLEGLGVPLTKIDLYTDFTSVRKESILDAWNTLLAQRVLTETTMPWDMAQSKAAFHMAIADGGESKKKQDLPLDLADEALKRWIRTFLIVPATS